MIVVIVAENDLFDTREIYFHLASVREHGLRSSTRVEEKTLAVDLYESRVAPFADAGVRKHRREYRDLEVTDLLRIDGLRCLGKRAENERCKQERARPESS